MDAQLWECTKPYHIAHLIRYMNSYLEKTVSKNKKYRYGKKHVALTSVQLKSLTKFNDGSLRTKTEASIWNLTLQTVFRHTVLWCGPVLFVIFQN